MVGTSLLSFIIRSEKRERILLALDKPTTPTKLAKELKLHRSHVSRSLSEFEKKGIVKCLTPKEKIGRLYELTREGREIVKSIAKSGD